MLTTFMWFGIGIMGAATLILWLLFPALTSWYEKNWPEDTPEDTKEASSVMISLATIIILWIIVMISACIAGVRTATLIPWFLSFVGVFVALVIPGIRFKRHTILGYGAFCIIVTLACALVIVVPFFNNGPRVVGDTSTRNTLVRSKLIEQNAQHTEAAGETFLGAGSFTLRSDSDLKIYHVWQERDSEGTLHVNIAQDGEGKDDKGRDRAVIRDDVPQGTEPYIERVPVYESDPLLMEENNGKLCIQGQDTGCHVNAQRLYDKVIIHVPAGSVVPSVDPNLPVEK
mgnify:FL=1